MTNKTQFEMVKEFHETFGHPVSDAPELPNVKRTKLRFNLILEELSELIGSVGGDIESNRYLGAAMSRIQQARELIEKTPAYEFKKYDIEHVAKELTDLCVVVQGTGCEFGINLDDTMVEVSDSNMSKLGEDGKPIYNDKGKILKGPNYRPADMKKALKLVKEEE